MKAETILKLIERALNPDLKQAHIKAYAQAMIEKDRERVKSNAKIKVISETEFEVIVDLKSICETPIILD
jgi:hypothetical protein